MSFALYRSVDNSMPPIVAEQLTDENMQWFARVAKASMVVGSDGIPRLFFDDQILGKESAEVGDYIVTDMAGRYWPCDKEQFEDAYVR